MTGLTRASETRPYRRRLMRVRDILFVYYRIEFHFLFFAPPPSPTLRRVLRGLNEGEGIRGEVWVGRRAGPREIFNFSVKEKGWME